MAGLPLPAMMSPGVWCHAPLRGGWPSCQILAGNMGPGKPNHGSWEAPQGTSKLQLKCPFFFFFPQGFWGLSSDTIFCLNVITFPVHSGPSQLTCIFFWALQGLGALQAAGLGQGGAGQAGDGRPCRGLYFSGTWLLATDELLLMSALEHQLGGKGVGTVP